MTDIDFAMGCVGLALLVIIAGVAYLALLKRRDKKDIVVHRGMLACVRGSSNRGLIGTPQESSFEEPFVVFTDGTSYLAKNARSLGDLSGSGVEVEIVRRKGEQIARVVEE